jgi:hypothetical protein
MIVAVMQPCYLPWRGYFALMRACDAFVHLDDVPLPRGRSYQTRVALQTAHGRHWLSLPVRRRAGQHIRDARLADDRWRRKHLATLRQHLPGATEIVADLLGRPWTHLCELNIALSERIAGHLSLRPRTFRSSELGAAGRKSDRILALCRALGATGYVTGHGARGYLDHEALERAGIATHYLDYDLAPCPRGPGGPPSDPYLTILDLLEHATQPTRYTGAALVPWREFLASAGPAVSPYLTKHEMTLHGSEPCNP